MSQESDKYVWVEGKTRPLNPYEPSAEAIAPIPKEEGALSTSYASFPRTVLVWSLVCGISALPGFVWGYMTVANQRPEGMIAGIMTFIVLYVALDYASRGAAIRAHSGIRLTLKIGYWTRLVVSIMLPIGMYIDLFAGMFAAMVLGVSHDGNANSPPAAQVFAISYFMTIVTGAFINLLVFVYMAIVFTLMSVYRLVANRLVANR